MRALDHLINCKNFQSFYKHKTIPCNSFHIPSVYAYFALVYSLFVPSQPVISQPDAVLKPNLATLFFFRSQMKTLSKK